MRRWIFSLLVLGLLTAAPAFAAPADKGFLIGGSIGQSQVTTLVDFTAFGNLDPSNLPTVKIDDEDFAWKAYVGYRVWNFFQAEGGYRDLGEGQDTSGNDVVTSKTTAWDAQALGILKISLVDLFLKAGVAWWDTEVSAGIFSLDDDGVSAIYGAGVIVRLKSLGIRLEYERVDVDVPDDLEMISAGVSWTF